MEIIRSARGLDKVVLILSKGSDLNEFGDRVDEPVLLHTESLEHPQFPAAIVPDGPGREDLDADVRRHTDGLVQMNVMSPPSRKDDDIGLQDVRFIEHDIDGGDEHDAAVLPDIHAQLIRQLEHRDLMSGERRRDHDHLAVMELVTATVIGPALQIPICHSPRDAQHGSHRSIVGDRIHCAFHAVRFSASINRFPPELASTLQELRSRPMSRVADSPPSNVVDIVLTTMASSSDE